MDRTTIQWHAEFSSPDGRPPQLETAAVHIWAISIAGSAASVANLLSEDERQRAGGFRRTADRERFVATRGYLRQVLGHYTARPAETLRFHLHAQGKPALIGNAEIDFSVSHSGAIALVAVAKEAAVGVDVEMVQPLEILETARLCCSDHELETLATVPEADRTTAFYRLWTLKEAYFKATGEGLRGPLRAVTIQNNREGGAQISGPGLREEHGVSWFLRTLWPAAGYVAAVALASTPAMVWSGIWNAAHKPGTR